MAEENSIWLNFDGPDFLADPYPTYRRLLAEDPVFESPWGEWYLSRFSDVSVFLSDRRFCWQSQGGVNPMPKRQSERTLVDAMFGNWMIFMDPPGHTRLRGLVSGFFAQKRIEAMRPLIQDTVDRLLGEVLETGSMDVIADLAYPLPVMVISGMLGVPVEDHVLFKEASLDLTKPLGSASDEDFIAAVPAAVMLTDYFRDLVTQRRKNPKEDIISSLVAAQDQDKGFGEDELLATCVFLLLAGHETTKNLIGNAVLILLRNPGQMDMLSRDPGMIIKAVEEFLRFESPLQRVSRWTSTDISIGGRIIPKGRFVTGLIGAAHRDPDRFEDPDRFDIKRGNGSNLAFGRGLHHCLGLGLARLEAQVAINSLLRRTRRLELAAETVEWQESTLFRCLKALPVTFSV